MSKVVRELRVEHAHGIHARPSHAIVTLASRFRADLRLWLDDRCADPRSILSVMSLGAPEGAVLRLEAEGPDAEEAARAFASLFAHDFQEEA